MREMHMENGVRSLFSVAALALLATAACGHTSELYCESSADCEDPARPYCDLYGDYPASEGHGKTCIPDPFGDVDAGVDAGVIDAPVVDADVVDGMPADAGVTSLTIAVVGNGTVISDPIGINCGSAASDCAADFAAGTSITLSATPDSDSDFTAWTAGAPAGCTGTGDCTFDLDSDESFSATFTLKSYDLTVTTGGDGSGGVTSTSPPGGIDCGSDCSETYSHGTVVALTAAATSGVFGGWSGACSGLVADDCSVTMDGEKSVGASFDLNQFTLSVSLTGTGGGSVTSSPGTISCPSGDCSDSYTSGTLVTLTAAPDGTSTFTGWSGCSSTGTYTCETTVNSAASVTAEFTAITYVLNVNKTGSGDGLVSSVPAGINCAPGCASTNASFVKDTEVTLSAQPSLNHSFIGWSGGGCSGAGTCVVTMSAARTVTANFESPHDIVVTIAGDGTGSGMVTSAPSGINCGAICTAAFGHNAAVTLTATADSDSTFIEWQGDCQGLENTCDLTVEADKATTAKFNLRGEHLGTRVFGNSDDNSGVAVAYDGDGNLFVAGNFAGVLDLSGGTEPMTPGGNDDYFVAKFSASGAYAWSKNFGGTGDDWVFDIAVDSAGDVLVAALDGVFVVTKLSGVDGGEVWSNPYSPSSGSGVTDASITSDSAGNAVIGGTYSGTISFGGGNLTSVEGSSDIFLLWLDPDGNHVRSPSYGTAGADELLDIDAAGDHVVFVGSGQAGLDLGGGVLSEGVGTAFVAKFSDVGAHVWSTPRGFAISIRAVATNVAGEVFITGRFGGDMFPTTNLGGDTLTAQGYFDVFVAGYEADGAHIWSISAGAPDDVGGLYISNNEGGRAIAVDGRGFVNVLGIIKGSADFGGGTLSGPNGSDDLFLLNLDGADGTYRWATVFGGSDGAWSTEQGVAVDPLGNIAATGSFEGSGSFADQTPANQGLHDIFLTTRGP